jgi:hypothetical protein
MVLVTICGTFLTNSTTVSASELVLNEQTSYSYTGVIPHLGYAITHDLKCKAQGRMIQVSIPASAGAKNFEYNAEVELINPTADTVATATFQGADVDWYIKAEDIVLKKSQNNAQSEPKQNQDKK